MLRIVSDNFVILRMRLRKATTEDIAVVMLIFEQARRAQRRAGFRQWEDGYPPVEKVESDISAGAGYILDDDSITAGYIAIAMGDEEYDRHPKLWMADGPYAVFHRIAISDAYRGRGVSSKLFDLAEDLARRNGTESIRIDTGVDNRPMQHILKKRGYNLCGECDFVWGLRLAYEKRL